MRFPVVFSLASNYSAIPFFLNGKNFVTHKKSSKRPQLSYFFSLKSDYHLIQDTGYGVLKKKKD
ncbi:hypothetical protein DICPUDRAFT_155556 [Dictyostelium purpureum]|uniref:Uncharacterized protein n=1 Tax=Dictyostelium purpureum TaxID=5786 RepID=F0ZUB5_DICPU|nr:uncharacterized protein DICPUDRAFT_155556 [Dictyostelium purpureum]EGC32477.1 hypothetical protein DICPUDRAFT_155556 [Dictyostelium purpureum]|eukprot:XP_003291011.1 hypothetical protein DICPUDRAFT_155556 [Dictyostelium purpureum]